uniref:DUF4116 domain-containing protein n=1 Tax=Noctiluca scintillans TaxID=2966 RepID=A0A7S1A9B8_NOCSC|mmetsp:Transcript_36944/g.98422  ORF Transcript_36944/g.98422 Transcript_36944/m.98422 type:complete len:124 (+) Transcript_36944:29-400(+)
MGCKTSKSAAEDVPIGEKLARAQPPQEVEWGRDAALRAVMRDGMMLRVVGKTHQADHNIVLNAVRQNGLALQFASEEQRADTTVVRAAMRNNEQAAQYVADSLAQQEDQWIRREGEPAVLIVE